MPTKTPTLERISVGPDADASDTARTSFWLWRQDLALLRALYRGQPGGYALHIRAAVHAMCNNIRADLAASDKGRELLHKLGQN
jgi:hypothetical protein